MKTLARLVEALSDLAPGSPQAGPGGNPLVGEAAGVTSDSREVAAGFVFVAVRGGSSDGHDFIPAVQQAGAALIVGERPAAELKALAAPYVQVRDSRLALARLASEFYDHPSRRLLMIGVTGTSGKTTTTYLVEAMLRAAGHDVGVIGTVNFRQGGRVLPSTHTTPGAVELNRLLAEMRAGGATAVVMEVSSHALKQHRVAEIAFDVAVFNNLSREHLDFHPDMEDYFHSKAILFRASADHAHRVGKRPAAVVNEEDEYGRRLLEELRGKKHVAARGFKVAGWPLEISLKGIRGEAQGLKIDSALVGSFNAANLLAAAGACQAAGIPNEAIERGIRDLRAVPGRLERVPSPSGIHVVVDYAHKPDALEKVLRTLAAVKGSHRLITVFGCGGDRDRTKRPVMGKLAVELSDRVVITSDNPRTENPDAIIREILGGVGEAGNFEVEADRRQAIFKAIAGARAGDLVVIAGKGHEDYQIIAQPGGGTTKIHFDDREVAAEALATRG